MDDLTKSLMRDMIREELAALLPGALAAALKAQPKPRASRAKAVDLTPIYDQVQERMASMEAQVLNMVNSAESRMSAHLSAALVLRQDQP